MRSGSTPIKAFGLAIESGGHDRLGYLTCSLALQYDILEMPVRFGLSVLK